MWIPTMRWWVDRIDALQAIHQASVCYGTMCSIAPITLHANLYSQLFTPMNQNTSFVSRALRPIAAALLLTAPIACASEEGATSIFDGKTLAGWKVVKESNAKFWSVEDGVITKFFEEKGRQDNCPTDPFEVSDVNTMLAYLRG